MKLYSVILAVACIGMAAAQGLSALPACARDCATGSIPSSCSMIDVKCICSNKSFIEGISCCVADKCSPEHQQVAIKFANQICGGQGVTDLPQSAGCASGSQSATDISSGSSVATTKSSSATDTNKSNTTATRTASTASHTAPPATASTTSSSSDTSKTGSATSSASAAATSTAGAAIAHKDASLIAAAGAAAAAFALLA